MARFYQTSEMDFIDYLQPQDATAAAAADTSVSSAFGDIKSIPQDRQILAQTLAGYEAEINELTQQLQADPKAIKRLEPSIASLRQRIAQDRQTGVLKAIQDRYDQDAAARKGIVDNLKDDSFQAAKAVEEYQANIPDLAFDPLTRTYNQITPMAVSKPMNTDDWEAWKKSNSERIEEQLLQVLSDQQKLDSTNRLISEADVLGVTAPRATEIFAKAVTPDMVRAAEQQRRYYGGQGDPETQFLNEDGTPNLNTVIGRQIASSVDAVTRQTVERWRNVYSDKAAEAAISNRYQNQSANWWADKLGAVWANVGNENARGRSQAALSELRTFVQGAITPDNFRVETVELGTDGTPYVVLRSNEKAPERKQGMTDAQYQRELQQFRSRQTEKRVPLNIEMLPSLGFSEEFTGKIGSFAQEKPNYDRRGERFVGQPRPDIEQARQPARQQERYNREFGQSVVGEFYQRNGNRELTPTQVRNLVQETARRGAPLTEQQVRDEYQRLRGGAQPVPRPNPPAARPSRPAQGAQQGNTQQRGAQQGGAQQEPINYNDAINGRR